MDEELTKAAQAERHLTVTTNQQGEAVMVSWQDDEHRILEVVWERKQATPEPVREAPIWNSIQIASWIGSQLMHEPAMFERSGVCKFVRSLGRHPTLLKHSPKDHVAAHQPTKEN